jgi:hypothetical protein
LSTKIKSKRVFLQPLYLNITTIYLSSFFRLLEKDRRKTDKSEEKTAKKAYFGALFEKISYVCRQKSVVFYLSLSKRQKKKIASKC